MKTFMSIILASYTLLAQASNYYISSKSGEDTRTSVEAQDSSSPWQSLNRLNIFNGLKPGDSVFFKRGETFYGTLIINSSGSLKNVIFYGSYGMDSKNPIISGLSQLSTWTLYHGNIYYASLDVPSLNLITLDGSIKSMGRYPNKGYLYYSSHSGNTSISGTTVGAIPFDPVGGEVVIRKARHILDRHPITSRSSNTLNYSTDNNYGNNDNYEPLDGNGYFIQNSLRTLDIEGDWYYDRINKRLYMCFGISSPRKRIIKASSVDKNFVINSQNYITINDLDFEGSNTNGCYIVAAHNITLNNCHFIQQGGNALYGIDVSHITISKGSISGSLNNSIWVEARGAYINADGVKIYNSGTIAGAGRSGDAAQLGIGLYGDNITVANCSIINTGYNGIDINGNNALIEHNFVDSFCTIKDDGGGIYTYIGEGSTIKNNIVLNAIGSYEGAHWGYWEPFGKAAGIYLDNGTNAHNAMVSGNTIAHGEWAGIFINNNAGNKIANNFVYNYLYPLFLLDYSGALRDLMITNNKLVAKNSSQYCFRIELGIHDDLSLLGTIDNNIYTRAVEDDLIFSIYRNYAPMSIVNIGLATWQLIYNHDKRSKKKVISNYFNKNLNSIINNQFK